MRVFAGLALAAALVAGPAAAQPARTVAMLGLHGQTATITAADLTAGPRTTLPAEIHGETHTYEGVALTALLTRIEAPGGQALRGQAMQQVVLVSARDNYRVVFALSELDPGFGAKNVILADRVDGRAIPESDGPFRLVVEGDRRGARSVRMVTRIEVRRVD